MIQGWWYSFWDTNDVEDALLESNKHDEIHVVFEGTSDVTDVLVKSSPSILMRYIFLRGWY